MVGSSVRRQLFRTVLSPEDYRQQLEIGIVRSYEHVGEPDGSWLACALCGAERRLPKDWQHEPWCIVPTLVKIHGEGER